MRNIDYTQKNNTSLIVYSVKFKMINESSELGCLKSRFRAKKTSMSRFSGRREAHLEFTTWPAVLKALSLGIDVAGMQRYLRASFDKMGNSFSFFFPPEKWLLVRTGINTEVFLNFFGSCKLRIIFH